MHKSSERSDNGCVWNEDAPTVVSCAFFRLSEPVVIFNHRLFCVPPYRSDGKDTATLFLSAETDEGFQRLLRRFARSGADFTWMCPLYPRMESGVSEPERLHFVRLNAEEMLNE